MPPRKKSKTDEGDISSTATTVAVEAEKTAQQLPQLNHDSSAGSEEDSDDFHDPPPIGVDLLHMNDAEQAPQETQIGASGAEAETPPAILCVHQAIFTS